MDDVGSLIVSRHGVEMVLFKHGQRTTRHESTDALCEFLLDIKTMHYFPFFLTLLRNYFMLLTDSDIAYQHVRTGHGGLRWNSERSIIAWRKIFTQSAEDT